MAYVDAATKQTVIDAVNNPEVGAALAVLDITPEEVDVLTGNLRLLAGADGKRLWPDADTWLDIEQNVLLEFAAAAVARHRAAETDAGRTLVRDSETMVLELVHAAADPAVLNNAPEQWLWSPLGPPMRGDYRHLAATERYPAHAAARGQRWDRAAVGVTVRYEVQVQKARIAKAAQIMEHAADALTSGYSAANDSADILSQGVAVVANSPRGPWPARMGGWSDVGWNTAGRVRRSAHQLLDAAASAAVVEVLQGVDTNEERGVLVAAARARLEALRRWWDTIGPVRPAAPADGSVDVSFWVADTDPSGFWLAAMTAAWLEFGRSQHGGDAGIAAALLGR